MKSTILRYLLVLAVLMPHVCYADRAGYYIRDYKVEAVVSRSNVWDITETVDLTFTEPRHGFYRYVPERFKFLAKFADEIVYLEYVCDICDTSVDDWEYTTYNEDNNIVFRIGSEDKTVVGDQTYVIRYKLVYPDDRLARYTDKPWDFINHTLLPVDCNVPIEHFSFNVRYEKALPDDFIEKLKVYYGHFGDTIHAEGLTYDVHDNMIVGTMDSIPPLHTITIYAPMEEGFFEDAMCQSEGLFIALFWVTMALIVITFFAELTAKHPSVTKTIEFYPPDDISSAEVGTIIDESADLVDLTSLIPWWASKGYIAIEETADKRGRGGKHALLTLTKRRNLPSASPDYQRKFWNMLFGSKDTVVLNDIGEKPKEMVDAQTKLGNTFTGKRKITTVSSKVLLLVALAIAGLAMFLFSSAVESCESNSSIMGVGAWLIPFAVACCIVGSRNKMKWMGSKVVTWLLVGIRLALMLGALWLHNYVCIDGNPDSFITKEMLAAVYVGAFVVVELSSRFYIDTPYRATMMGRLLGLKEFIETAEKPQLESLQHDDPQYFYRILPFAMVFGLTDKWTKLFRDIPTEQPDWYRSQFIADDYRPQSLIASRLTSSTLNTIKVISHDSSKSSSGSFSSSGGGRSFAGGGGGGGGCGSW